MTFRLYDTATRSVRDFVPLVEGKVGIYHCGLTVQGAPHIGHIRKEVVFDVLRRWLERSGLRGHRSSRNVTDIDDKILVKAAEAGTDWFALAYANERALHAAYDVLGCVPPTYEPRATGHITEMVELMGELIERGHAYPADDGSGDVYFDVRSWPEYGALSNQRIDDMAAAEDADPRGKRDPRDFALWKGHKPGEPETASWPTPWGRGRPGWHLECSAMVGKYLGPEFDIHGGGLDLRFPHHENELAQSTAAGRPFARWWMHNAMLNLGGSKMSKSVGNTMLVSEVVKRVRPIDLRYYLVASHYRSIVEFSWEALEEAAAAFGRIEGFVRRAHEVLGGEAGPADGVALRRVHRGDGRRPRRACRAGGAAGRDPGGQQAARRRTVGRAARRLVARPARCSTSSASTRCRRPGPAPARPRTCTASSTGWSPLALQERAEARARKDWAAADRVRDALAAAGVAVEDTPNGPRWTLADTPIEETP